MKISIQRPFKDGIVPYLLGLTSPRYAIFLEFCGSSSVLSHSSEPSAELMPNTKSPAENQKRENKRKNKKSDVSFSRLKLKNKRFAKTSNNVSMTVSNKTLVSSRKTLTVNIDLCEVMFFAPAFYSKGL